jgi:hypothetical protein
LPAEKARERKNRNGSIGALSRRSHPLTLAESKTILTGVQETMVAQQAAAYLATQQTCPLCGTSRRRKGHHQIVVRSLIGAEARIRGARES